MRVVLGLPAVGENLEDHLAVHMQHRCTKPVSLLAMRKKYRWPGFAAQWLLTGTGPGASNHQEATSFYRSDETQDRPDIMMSFAALAMRSEEGAQVDGHGYQLHVGVMRSEARGSVHLRSANPAVHPAIRATTCPARATATAGCAASRSRATCSANPLSPSWTAARCCPGRASSSPTR